MAYFSKRYHPTGTPPGMLSKSPAADSRPLRIHLIDYTNDAIDVRNDVKPSECLAYLRSESRTWIHVEGHPDEKTLKELADSFGIHILALEDVINSGQRPKVETFDDQLFIILSIPRMVEGLVELRQVSFFAGSTFIVSFSESGVSQFEPVIERLRNQGSRLRRRQIDFLLHALLDMVIDEGFPVLEDFGTQLENLEARILSEASHDTLEQLHTIRRELILLRRALWPQREVVNRLLRDEFGQINEETLVYLRDCYDHTVQILDLLETYRDMTSSMLDIYLSSVSNKTNEVMRVLTVIATIFIPLTFIAGVYGMNFDRSAGRFNMPELAWPFGYLAVWLVMIVIAGVMLAFFRRRKWF
jgi:magnesium transporter